MSDAKNRRRAYEIAGRKVITTILCTTLLASCTNKQQTKPEAFRDAAANLPTASEQIAGPPQIPAPEQPPVSTRTVNIPDQALPGKTAFLTFDDGPSESTAKILAILRRYGVKATFFVTGKLDDESKLLYRQIVNEGHALGNHTFSHDYKKIYKSPQAFKQEVNKLSRLLEQTTGQKPDILRFPGGSNNKISWKYGGHAIMHQVIKDMRNEGYQYFDWNVSSTDAAAPVQERDVIIGSVLGASQSKKKAIILMHDNTRKTTTLEALPVIIEGLKKMGFAFDVLNKKSFTFQFFKPERG